MLEILGDSIIIACGTVFLGIFLSIFITGGYMAVEENPFILWGEIGMSCFIIAIGLNRYLNDIGKK